MKNKQLYSLIPYVEFPAVERFDNFTGEVISTKEIREGYYSFRWPDGSTCMPVEMFLLDISNEKKISVSDGGTVGGYARNLTHLVRYCFKNKIQFWDLQTSNIDDLISELSTEVNEFNERERNNNTIKTIISNAMTFLKWIQNQHFPERNIIGVDSQYKRYQVKLTISLNRYGKPCEVFPSKIPNATTQPKKPIADKIIKLLWETLNQSKSSTGINKRLMKHFSKQEQKDHIDYMFHRRRFQLTMLEATGLRPQELISISVKNNIKNLADSKIEISTLKRGAPHRRIVPIDQGTVIKIEIFLSIHRKKLIERLIKHGFISSENEVDDVLFLHHETGKKVKPDAAYQEFRRLCIKAGIKQKTCQSMFRHRFCTNMVKLHLLSFMDKNPAKSRFNFSDSDYRTILTKVATFTGHKDPTSLEFYIDWAWEELDVFSYVYDVSHLQGKLKEISRLVSDLKGELYGTQSLSKTKLELVDDVLKKIENFSDLTSQKPS
ncbi:site-specific integrase [Vibrio kanaloae]|uniref:Site-specific integrase n=1 Tax=Vibrio kanaloae TaxID=170673 RepID=A0A4U1ZRS5_9VIBR|nr:site-specific integrase [Vibrio kanaloae]TKF36101.1 site-specific integrase [Vibrio kanaloae]